MGFSDHDLTVPLGEKKTHLGQENHFGFPVWEIKKNCCRILWP